jgi:hypothetical protein
VGGSCAWVCVGVWVCFSAGGGGGGMLPVKHTHHHIIIAHRNARTHTHDFVHATHHTHQTDPYPIRHINTEKDEWMRAVLAWDI